MRFSIRVKLLIFAALVWAVIFGVYSVYIYKDRTAQTRRMAVNTASYLSRRIIAERQYYTSTIIKRAMESGIPVKTNYHEIEGAIPMPTTFIKEISASLGAEGGFQMSIVSLTPVNPASLPKDDFQKVGLEKFLVGGGTSHYVFQAIKDMSSIRYMIPDVASSETCVNCHNALSASRGHTYKIGDVMGALEITLPIESEMAAAMSDIVRAIVYGFFVILGMGLVGLVYIRRVVTDPIMKLLDTTKLIARGDLTSEAVVSTNDEAGDLGRSTNEVVRNLHSMIEDIRGASDEATDISGSVRDMSRHALEGSNRQGASLDAIGANMGEINTSIGEIARYTEALAESVEKGSYSVAELSSDIDAVVNNMEALFVSVGDTASSTKGMSSSIKIISDNVEQLSASVNEVSTSMSEINASIKEVDRNAAEGASFADEVIKDAKDGMIKVEHTIAGIVNIKEITRESTEIINNLSEKIKEIGKILDVINDVAEETNMLALNAAIIAAQSGEHGKSFSVVATEIKDLAERVSTSTKEVSGIIGALEVESNRAVKAMGKGYLSVENGVRLSMEAGEGLKKIMGSAGRSTDTSREIAKAAAEQARQSRLVVSATERVAEMTHRIVKATKEHARGSELINKASERMADIALRVKESTKSQAQANRQITSTIDDVNKMVTHINNAILEQGRNTVRVLDAIDAVRKISFEHIEMSNKTDKAVAELTELNRKMTEGVKRFKLG